jgi:hypothetical protein
VGEEAEVANAHESPGQHMQQEPPQELFHGQRHDPLLIFVGGIAPPEHNATVCEGHEAVSGNRNAMGVAAEIVQRMLGVAKRALGIDHPIGSKQAPEHRRESFRGLNRRQVPVKGEFVAGMQPAQAGHKLAPEHAAEHLYREKEVVRSGNPSAMIGRQATSRNNTMDMRMMQ